MRSLFSGNSDLWAVVLIVLTVGAASAIRLEERVTSTIALRNLNRTQEVLQRERMAVECFRQRGERIFKHRREQILNKIVFNR